MRYTVEYARYGHTLSKPGKPSRRPYAIFNNVLQEMVMTSAHKPRTFGSEASALRAISKLEATT